MDKKEKVVIPFIYDVVFDFENGIAITGTNGLYGIVTTNGRGIIPVFSSIPVIKDGMVYSSYRNEQFFVDPKTLPLLSLMED